MDQTRADLTSQASAQQARAAAGLRELADQLGSMAGSTDQDGMARALVDDVARRAGDAASWLDQRDPGSVLEEARTFARRRPGAFLAVAAGVGVVAGRLSRSLVDDAREGSSATTAATAGSGSGSPAGTGVTDAGMPSAARPTRKHQADGPGRHADADRSGRSPHGRGRRRRPPRRPMSEQFATRDDLPDPSLRSVGDVLSDITSDLSTLLRQEVELAKAELRETADHAKAAGGMFAGAGVAGHLALIFLSLALWWALGDLFDSLGWSALVVGLLWAAAAAVMVAMGRTRMRKATPVAPRTVDTAKDIPDALRGHETR